MPAQGVRGFTLIELLTTLAIAGILCILCTSGFSAVIESHNRNTTMQVAITTLDRARSLAVREAKPVGVCLFDAQSNCNPAWSTGDLGIFIDTNKNRVRDSDEAVLFRQPWPGHTITLSWANNFRSEPTITYQENGSVTSNGTLKFIDKNGSIVQKIVISKVGRARIEN